MEASRRASTSRRVAGRANDVATHLAKMENHYVATNANLKNIFKIIALSAVLRHMVRALTTLRDQLYRAIPALTVVLLAVQCLQRR